MHGPRRFSRPFFSPKGVAPWRSRTAAWVTRAIVLRAGPDAAPAMAPAGHSVLAARAGRRRPLARAGRPEVTARLPSGADKLMSGRIGSVRAALRAGLLQVDLRPVAAPARRLLVAATGARRLCSPRACRPRARQCPDMGRTAAPDRPGSSGTDPGGTRRRVRSARRCRRAVRCRPTGQVERGALGRRRCRLRVHSRPDDTARRRPV